MKLRSSLLQSKQSIGRFLVVSYLIVFVCLVFGLLAGYFAAYTALLQQEVIAQEQTLIRVQGTVDSLLSKVYGQISAFALSSSTRDYTGFDEDATVIRARAMAATLDNADVVNSLLPLDAKLYAYFFNSSLLVGANGVVKKAGLSYYLKDNLNLTEEGFFEIIALSDTAYRTITVLDAYSADCRIVITQNIIGSQRRSVDGLMFVVIPYDSLADAMQIDVIPGGAYLYLSDDEQALNGIEVNVDNSVHTQRSSEYLPYHYSYVVPNAILHERLGGYALLLRGILAFSILSGILVTVWIMRSRLKLFQRLVRAFVPERKEARHITIEQIEERLKQYTKEHTLASRRQEDQIFLKALDSGHDVDSFVPLEPGKDGYDLILIHDSTLDDGSDAPLYTHPETREAAIRSAYEAAEDFARKFSGCAIRDDSLLLVLLPADINIAVIQEAELELIRRLREIVRPRFFGCAIRIADKETLSYGYSYALNALFHKSFWSLDTNEMLTDVSSAMAESAEQESGRARIHGNRAYRSIAVGAYTEAYDLLVREIGERFQRRMRASSNNIAMLHGMSAMIVTMLLYRAPEADRELIQSVKPGDQLLKCNTLASFEEALRRVFKLLMENETNRGTRTPKWFERLRVFLEENYRDSNLSAAMVTQKLGINASYASEEFRKYTGVGIPDTIHMLRIAEAKTLLARGVSVKAAAQHLGYVDSRALIRAFKKYEGMTPGQYIDEFVKANRGVESK